MNENLKLYLPNFTFVGSCSSCNFFPKCFTICSNSIKSFTRSYVSIGI